MPHQNKQADEKYLMWKATGVSQLSQPYNRTVLENHVMLEEPKCPWYESWTPPTRQNGSTFRERRGSGRKYPLHAHRVYGAEAKEPMLLYGLFHQSSSSFFPLPMPLLLGSLRTSEPIGARSTSISNGGSCERAKSSSVDTASFRAARAARCGRMRRRNMS